MAQIMAMKDEIITVKARAKAKIRELTVGSDGIYKIKTPQPSDKNKANEDIVEILAEHFGISRSQIELISGQTYTLKKFRIFR